MKALLFIIISVGVLLSCDNNDNKPQLEVNTELIGKWNLSFISSNFVGASTIPDENNTHYYQINADRTFKRISIKDNKSEELKGTYILTDENPIYKDENNSTQKFVELSYSSNANFFSCGFIAKNKQLLKLSSNNTLSNMLATACDGPGYGYTKEK